MSELWTRNSWSYSINPNFLNLFMNTLILDRVVPTISATGSQVSFVPGVPGAKQPPWVKGTTGCNIYWQVGSSATIGDSSTFVGEIMALASITLDGGTLWGRALASNGAVTMATQETIRSPLCFTRK